MELKWKDYINIATVALAPFILLLVVIKSYFSKYLVLSNKIFWIFTIIMIIIWFICYVISLFYNMEEIRTSNDKTLIKVLKYILVIIGNLFYISFRYLYKIEKISSVFVPILDITLLLLLINPFEKVMINYFDEINYKDIIINPNIDYYDKDYLFRIRLNSNYSCLNDLGEYKISCEKNDDSFIGIYNYKASEVDSANFNDIYEFHVDQSISYILEEGITYQKDNIDSIDIITYNDMYILISRRVYKTLNDHYMLIFIYEGTGEYNLDSYNNLLDTIVFN